MPGYNPTNNPSAAVDDATVGTKAWAGETNVYAADTIEAQVTLYITDTISHYLVATGFGFAIPADSTILGVVVGIKRRNIYNTGELKDYSIKLTVDGSITGDNKASVAAWPYNTAAYATYGSATSLWGCTLTPTLVNQSDFGVAISCTSANAGTTDIGCIDHIYITVYATGKASTKMMVIG